MRKNLFHKKGFTLIELLVVVAIISLLSSIVFSSLNGARSKARDAQRKSDLIQMRNALELCYSNSNGCRTPGYLVDYPLTDGSIVPSCLSCEPSISVGPIETKLLPSYLAKIPLDPGGSIFKYYLYYNYQDPWVFIQVTSPTSGIPPGYGLPFTEEMKKKSYVFYTKLENSSQSDPNFISETVGDSLDRGVARSGYNYRIGN